jgi:hypothetical protein
MVPLKMSGKCFFGLLQVALALCSPRRETRSLTRSHLQIQIARGRSPWDDEGKNCPKLIMQGSACRSVTPYRRPFWPTLATAKGRQAANGWCGPPTIIALCLMELHQVLSAADTDRPAELPHATSRELNPLYIALPACQMRALAEQISACEPPQAPS